MEFVGGEEEKVVSVDGAVDEFPVQFVPDVEIVPFGDSGGTADRDGVFEGGDSACASLPTSGGDRAWFGGASLWEGDGGGFGVEVFDTCGSGEGVGRRCVC